MRIILVILISLSFSQIFATPNEDLHKIYLLMQEDRVAAIDLILELKLKNDAVSDELWKVRSNFYLAYTYKMEGEFGKSVIYYLEAIRYSENAKYDGVTPERIALHKNLAAIFQQFKAHNLASDYNRKALELAEFSKNLPEVLSVKYNEAKNLRDIKNYGNSIDLFLSTLPDLDESGTPRILNEIGITYMLNEDIDNAELYFNKLIRKESTPLLYKAKALHNLAEISFSKGNTEDSRTKLLESIKIKESLNKTDYRSLLYSYKILGNYSLEIDALEDAGQYLSKAESLSTEIDISVEHFDLYDLLAKYNYEVGNPAKSQHYSNVYSTKLKSYISLQEEIQETDKRYNMDLITKRYFDEVAKQEKIASILFYSRLTSGSLLVLLLLVIGYNRYEKIRVRRRIEDHLVQLDMLD